MFRADQEFQLFNYILASSSPADNVSKGFVRVISNEISPQMFDRQSGIRFAVIRGKAVNFG
ncbi:hypothetical protein D3C85_1774500 [compost metagenome]